ncbi:MAG TPA: hypothetical protein VFR23_26015 [Jiangellaceae bacterium]|nr:hypothetical protein [Jiangellaceae bacterium]
MKVQEKLDEIVALVGAARTLPMSSSIVVNKAELTRLLTELGELLPDDLAQAEAVLSRRDAILYESTANAERLLTAAIEERQRMISEEEILRQARIEAAEVIRGAQERSDRTSREIDEYVDAKLAHLEVSVANILETVRQGRQRLAEPGLYRELAALPEAHPASERATLPRRTRMPEGEDLLDRGATDEWRAAPGWTATPQWDGPPQGRALPRRQAVTEPTGLPAGRAEPGGGAESPQPAEPDAAHVTEGGWTPQRPDTEGTSDKGISETTGQAAGKPQGVDGDEPAGAAETKSAGPDEPASDPRPQEARAE